jgi:hypothetical protein
MTRQLFDKPKTKNLVLRGMMKNVEPFEIPGKILIAINLAHDRE